jgi:hypothetical protein
LIFAASASCSWWSACILNVSTACGVWCVVCPQCAHLYLLLADE